jgi:lysophospholipase L1-like esterase
MDNGNTRASPRKPALGVLLLGMALLLGACGEHTPRLPPLPADAVVLAFGDSLTRGSGAGRGESYPAVLARLLGRDVINAGVPGELSSAGRTRLPGLLDRHRPALLLLCHGGNDLLRRLDPRTLRGNIEAMISAARERDIPVVLIGVPEPALFGLSAADLYDELAAQHALVYEGEIIAAVEGDARLKSDRIHPNAAGYRQIAQAVHRALRDSGAVDRTVKENASGAD